MGVVRKIYQGFLFDFRWLVAMELWGRWDVNTSSYEINEDYVNYPRPYKQCSHWSLEPS